MTKPEILARIAEYDPVNAFDTEASHSHYDEIVVDVLTYIADGGVDAAEVAAALLRHESPTQWGWYA